MLRRIPVRYGYRQVQGAGLVSLSKSRWCSVRVRAPLAVGKDLFVRLELPDRVQSILVPATVRWTNPTGMGVQFGLLRARETHAILEIERLLTGD